MLRQLNMAAADLGASGGRVVLGRFDGVRLDIEPIHRFPNIPVRAAGVLYWDILHLYEEIRQGFAATASAHGPVRSIGVDAWGNDFGLLGRNGDLLANPVHYRDDRTLGMMDEVFSRVPRQSVYERTGVQFMRFSGLYQLFSVFLRRDSTADAAHTFLLIPDLILYFLTGQRNTEFTDATTTQMFTPRDMDWDRELLELLGIPSRLFTSIIQPGSVIGELDRRNADELGLAGAKVVAVAEHDTASAVAAVPAHNEDFVYISSGTWSLVGIEVSAPIINDAALRYNFTNEGGVEGTFRFLKNVMGLWIVQQCRDFWRRSGQEFTYADLDRAAQDAEPFCCYLDPDDELFAAAEDMPGAIRRFCRETGQTPPSSVGEHIRCVLEGLALKYRMVLDEIEEIRGRAYSTIHVVGGGAQNELLCAFTANATGRRVLAGPTEATAIGNIGVQAIALGELSGVGELRDVVRSSFACAEYSPSQTVEWDEAYGRFKEILIRRGG